METPTMAGSFGEVHFGKAPLGDKRRLDRLILSADLILRHPAGTLPDKLKEPCELDGFYRLMNSESVTHEAVLCTHRELTVAQACAAAGPVLWIHDTTELDYSGLDSITTLGPIGNGGGRGYLCHNTLAVVADTREVLGVANQILKNRPVTAKKKKKESKKQSAQRADRESRLWKQGAAALPAASEGALWVDVADRGADLTEFLDFEATAGRSYVVRSTHNRVSVAEIAGETCKTKLHDHGRTLASQGERSLEVQAKAGKKARSTSVSISWTALALKPPRQARGEHGQEPLGVWLVRVWEANPPAGVEPLEWLLLTNVPVADATEAWQRVEWYRTRWMIEELHKGMKTGCGIETLQFTTEEALKPAIALLSVAAVKLLWLRHVSRGVEGPTRSAKEQFTPSEVEVLSAWRWEEARPDLTVQEFCYALARLGGHQNRKHDHPPGWLVLWRGWTKLQLMIEGTFALTRKRSEET